MATPADFFQTATLSQVTSIRTSGDHGYLVGPGFLWAWFCYTNALARALRLAPFKDVFASGGPDGEVEALLSALSTGPVGLGDAIGTTDAAVVAATCRADGVIVRPDVPIAAVDACFRTHAVARPVPLVAECHTDHAAGRWTQVFCANTFRGEQPVTGIVDLGSATPRTEVVSLDLRTGAVEHGTAVADRTVDLAPGAWTHHLLAPVLGSGIAVFGDVSKHAPVGRTRIGQVAASDGGVDIDVAGPEEMIAVSGWSRLPVVADGPAATVPLTQSADGPGWRWLIVVAGGTRVHVRPDSDRTSPAR